MTNSHNTSTPSMSAETVPSEEAAKLVYEAMVWARDQQPGVPVPKWIDGGNSDAQYEARRVIRKIADLSASHLAKEGEDDEETTLENRIDNAVQAMSETHHSWEARCHAIMAALGFNFGWKTPRVDEEPSPALAKGGDAVREALRNQIAKQLEDEADVTPDEEDASVVRRCARLVRANFSYDDADAALSTPTEGPASAEDWLRGMARMSSYPVEICQKFEDLADLIMERHNATA